MARFELRYDLRSPVDSDVDLASRYEAAIDQIVWGERHGFRAVTISEHHGTSDGYLPSPLVFAAAVATRTERITIRVAALIAAFHDPLRVAEDAAVVDQLSRGRLQLVIANGYVPDEFAMFGRALSDRVPAVVEMVETLKAAWTGEPFEYRGRTVRVTPTPYGEHRRPALFLGGASAPAARRAAHLADAFFPSDDTYWEDYRAELIASGGPDFGPMPPVGPRFLHVTDDVERDRELLTPYVVHDRESYGSWAESGGVDTGFRRVHDDPWEDDEYQVLTPRECVAMIRELGSGVTLPISPMMGGTPPELAWANLRTIVDDVMPALERAELA